MLRMLVILTSVLGSHTYSSGNDGSYRHLPGDVLKVTTVMLEPYVMLNPLYHYNSREPLHIGYIPDLMAEIAQLTDYRYSIQNAPDNSFGYVKNGAWDGMVGELLNHEADIAAAPMYLTSQREEVVDFTLPYMKVHATLLLRKPPKGVQLQIRSAADLLDQSEIQYGTLDRGVLVRAFKFTNSTTLRIMWRNMQRFEPSTFTSSNQEGIERVRAEKYAFVIPHTIGEYMSMQEPCDLVTVDKFLLNKGYSLAVNKRDRHLLDKLNFAIKTLDNRGRLNELYRKWWVGRGECNGIKTSKMQGAYITGYNSGAASAREWTSWWWMSVYLCWRLST